MSKRAVNHAAAYTRKIEQTSMLSQPNPNIPSPAGTPPFTHPRYTKSGGIRKAFPHFIRYKVEMINNEPGAVVGPESSGRRAGWAERIGRTHEFGGRYEQSATVYYGTKKNPRFTKIHLWKRGGGRSFNWKLLRMKLYKNGVRKFTIAYMASYPKRPFAQPALIKTASQVLLGRFGR
jgi:hypothetical protein